MAIHIVSFGFKQPEGVPTYADVILDVRDWFHDPHVSPELRELTGLDQAVVDSVVIQPGFQQYVTTIVAFLIRLEIMKPRGITIAIGCVGGRHRSVVVARAIDDLLRREFTMDGLDDGVTLSHRDISRSVLAR